MLLRFCWKQATRLQTISKNGFSACRSTKPAWCKARVSSSHYSVSSKSLNCTSNPFSKNSFVTLCPSNDAFINWLVKSPVALRSQCKIDFPLPTSLTWFRICSPPRVLVNWTGIKPWHSSPGLFYFTGTRSILHTGHFPGAFPGLPSHFMGQTYEASLPSEQTGVFVVKNRYESPKVQSFLLFICEPFTYSYTENSFSPKTVKFLYV